MTTVARPDTRIEEIRLLVVVRDSAHALCGDYRRSGYWPDAMRTRREATVAHRTLVRLAREIGIRNLPEDVRDAVLAAPFKTSTDLLRALDPRPDEEWANVEEETC